MRTVTHREMRNNSAEILRSVAAGETIRITNNGRVAALMVPPPPEDPIDALLASGQARPAVLPPGGFDSIPRRSSEEPTAAILRDLRGES